MDIQEAQEILHVPQPIETLAQFYRLMQATREVRFRIVTHYLAERKAGTDDINLLQNAYNALKSIQESLDGRLLAIDDTRKIAVDLSYEETELDKDLHFLTKGEDAFYNHLHALHPSLEMQLAETLPKLSPVTFRNLISDRDGTVNNYCGRYLSSIQSVYNAVFLTRFARKCVANAILLTSAPLENGGMVDICTMPDGAFILAGSKGREYRDKQWNRDTYPIEPEQQNILNTLTEQITELLQKDEFEKFSYIGSGFQQKFGQLTIARQDISQSIPAQESLDFLQILNNLVFDLDREKKFFRIEDTGLDVEIILTVGDTGRGESLRDFNKGDGVAFLDKKLHLEMKKGPNLICGDTFSDIAMLKTARKLTQNTRGIFVTRDLVLQEQVEEVFPKTIFLDEPDTLVVLLNELAKR